MSSAVSPSATSGGGGGGASAGGALETSARSSGRLKLVPSFSIRVACSVKGNKDSSGSSSRALQPILAVDPALRQWRATRGQREVAERWLVRSLQVEAKEFELPANPSPSPSPSSAMSMPVAESSPPVTGQAEARGEGTGGDAVEPCPTMPAASYPSAPPQQQQQQPAVVVVDLRTALHGRARPATPQLAPVSLTAVNNIAARRAITESIVKQHEARVDASQKAFRAKHQRRMDKLAKEIDGVVQARESIRRSMHSSGEGADTTTTGSDGLLGRSYVSDATQGADVTGRRDTKRQRPFYVACYDYCRGDGVVAPPPSGIADTPRHICAQAGVQTALAMRTWTDPTVERIKARHAATKVRKQHASTVSLLPALAVARRRVLNDDPQAGYWDAVLAADKLKRAATSLR